MNSKSIPWIFPTAFIVTDVTLSTFDFPPIAEIYFSPMVATVTLASIFFASGFTVGFASLS